MFRSLLVIALVGAVAIAQEPKQKVAAQEPKKAQKAKAGPASEVSDLTLPDIHRRPRSLGSFKDAKALVVLLTLEHLHEARTTFGQAVNGRQNIHRDRLRDATDVGLGLVGRRSASILPSPCGCGCAPS